jgi:DNA-binding SARP family transcriptional activator/TolB-like protein
VLRLQTLGRLSLIRDEAGLSDAASRRKPLLLLAVLAAAGSRATSRDALTALLWPDSDDESARTVLRQTLYALRRTLAEPELVLGTSELALNPAVIQTDVGEFLAAAEAGALQRAVGAYGGPFLDGVPLNGELERWAARTRERLGRLYTDAIERLATDAEKHGDTHDALRWWRTLAGSQPLSAHGAMGLMRVLAASGDRAGALAHGRIYTTLIRQELDVDPDPAVVSLLAALRDDPGGAIPPDGTHNAGESDPSGNAGTSPSARDSTSAAPQEERVDASFTAPTESTAAAPAHRSTRRSRVLAVPLALAAIVLLLGLAKVVASGARDGAGSVVNSRGRVIAVLPFTVRGARSSGYLGEAMVYLLSMSLRTPHEVSPVDPRTLLGAIKPGDANYRAPDSALNAAGSLGAGSVVLGDIVAVGGRLRVTASLYDSTHHAEPITTVDVECDTTEVFAAVDAIASQLLATLHPGAAGQMIKVATLSTRSLAAFKAFLTGEEAYRQARFADAVVDFQRAVALDSSFALANYQLAMAGDWAGLPSVPLSAAEAAYRDRAHLPPRYRLLLDGFRSWRAGDLDGAEASYRDAIASDAGDEEAWYQLGEVLFHDAGLRTRSPQEARAAFEQVLLLDPVNRASLIHLLRLAAQRNDAPAVDSLARLLAGGHGNDPDSVEIAAFRAASIGDTTSETLLLAALAARGDYTTYSLAEYLGVYAHDLHGAEQLVRLLLPRRSDRRWRVRGETLLATFELAQGRWNEAKAALDTSSYFDDIAIAEARAYFAAMPSLPIAASDVRSAREKLAAVPWSSRDVVLLSDDLQPAIRPYLRALLDVRLADTADLTLQLERLRNVSGDSVLVRLARGYVLGVSALLSARAGHTDEALREVDAARPRLPLEQLASPFGGAVPERLLRARLLEEKGLYRQALASYATLAKNRSHELAGMGPALLGEASVLERLGDTNTAIERYDTLVRLWGRADPAFQPFVRRAFAARARLARAPAPGR